MNKLICDICGGAIVVQVGGKYGICDCCGANYTLDRMREIASGIKVSQTGSKEDVEQWKSLLDTYLSAFDWEAAESTLKKILEAVPTDEYSLDVYKRLQSWKDYVIKDGTMVEYKGISNVIDIPYGVKCLDFRVVKRHSMKDGIKIIIPDTVEHIENFAFSHLLLVLYAGDERLHYGLDEVFIPNSVEYINDNAFKGGGSDFIKKNCALPRIYLPKRFKNQKFVSETRYSAFDDEIFEYYLEEDFIFYDENETYESIKECIAREKAEAEREEKLRANRRYDGVCQYCGGAFKGLFNERCSVCGKEKDY